MAGHLEHLVSRLEAVTTRIEAMANKSAGGAAEDFGEIVEAYDQFMSGNLAKYLKLSSEIGGDMDKHIIPNDDYLTYLCPASLLHLPRGGTTGLSHMAKLVQKAFNAQRAFIVVVSKHKTPSPDVLQKLLQTTSSAISDVQDFREKNRGSKMFNHLSALSEGIPALGWVTVTKGANYVNEMKGSADFYLNRVLKEYKETAPKHVDWVKAVKGIFSELCDYIKEHHSSGLTWNPSGPPAPTSVPAGPGGPGAPPPPPPPAVQPPTALGGEPGKPMAASALFGEINKAGTNISSGLRKVTNDQKTHKNPNLRLTSVVKDKPKPTITAKKPVVAAKKPPVFQLEGKKWMVDYQENNQNLVIEGEKNQVVYVYTCKNSTIQIKGKVNSINLDNCKKCAVVFDDAIATVEFVNCQSVQCQINGKVPTVLIDKTDGCQVYLSKHSLETEIVTAKSSEMNILVPKADGDYEEYPLPEQYKTLWNGKAFDTTPSSSHG